MVVAFKFSSICFLKVILLRNVKILNDECLAFKAYGEGTMCAGMWCVGYVVV